MIVGSKFPPNRVGFSNVVFGGFLLVGTADFGNYLEYLKEDLFSTKTKSKVGFIFIGPSSFSGKNINTPVKYINFFDYLIARSG